MRNKSLDLSDYERQIADYNGNPTPIDAMALVFRDGRACVCVRLHKSGHWHEVMSAPGTSEDGLACGIDLRRSEAVASAPYVSAEVPRGTP